MVPLQSNTESDVKTAVRQLMLEPEAAKRQRLYHKIDQPLELIHEIKAEVDKYKDKDSSVALHLGTCALELSELSKHPEARPLALWAYALGLTVQGQFDEALKRFEEARTLYKAIDKEDEAARVAMRQIQALAMTGEFDKATTLAKLTRSQLRQYGYELDALTVDNNLGIIYRRLGQFDKAQTILETALAGFDAVEDASGKVLTLINLGNVSQEQDQVMQAELYFKEALELAEALGQHKHIAGTMVNLALLYRGIGRHREALKLLTRVRHHYEQLAAGPGAALAQLEEARLHLELNLFNEAIDLATDLVEIFGSKEMTLEQTEALQVLGLAQARKGNQSEALTTLEKARKLWNTLGNQVQSALTELSIAALKLELADLSEAQTLAEKASLTLKAFGARSNQTLAYLLCTEILMAQKQARRAKLYLAQAKQAGYNLDIPELNFRMAYIKGKLALEDKNLKEAKLSFEEAINCLENVHGNLPMSDFRAAYMGDKLVVYEAMITLLNKQNDLPGIFEYIERAKSRALLTLLSNKLDAPRDDPQTLALTKKLEQAREALSWYTLHPERNREKLLASERNVTQLMRELGRLSEDNGGSRTTRIPTLTELQNQLDSHTVWIEYFERQGALCALVITQGDINYYPDLVLANDIHQAFEWLEFYFSRSALGEAFGKAYGEKRLNAFINETLHTLYKFLISPLKLSADAQALLVSPHGLLYNVPFGALFDGEAYLSDSYSVTLIPSASIYLHANHSFDNAPASLVAFGMQRELPNVERELESIAKQVKEARLYLNDAATLETFLAEAPTATVVHIATHGQFRSDNPSFSSLSLQDGNLTPRDLYATRLKASLVVLSACQSGRVGGFYGDDLIGLTRGFLDAGASALVTTLWPTKDEQTAQFMISFYKGLSKSLSIIKALEQAQRELRSDYPNPYFWAAFSLIGNAGRSLNFTASLQNIDSLAESGIS